jgi:hypothetical protein
MKKQLISCNLSQEQYKLIKALGYKYAFLIEKGLDTVTEQLQTSERLNELEQSNKKLYSALIIVQRKLHEYQSKVIE